MSIYIRTHSMYVSGLVRQQHEAFSHGMDIELLKNDYFWSIQSVSWPLHSEPAFHQLNPASTIYGKHGDRASSSNPSPNMLPIGSRAPILISSGAKRPTADSTLDRSCLSLVNLIRDYPYCLFHDDAKPL